MANSAIKITNIPVANLITLNSKFLSVESDIDRTQLITANDLVTYLANTALYKNQVNTTFALANSAYNIANISLSQANSAYNMANISLNQANSAYNMANISLSQANAAFNLANLSFNQANAAFNHANLSFNRANTALNQANSAYNTANIAYEVANSVISIQSFNQFAENANTALLISQIAYQQANVAYSAANTKFSSSGGTITGPVEISSSLLVTGNVTFSGNVTTISANNIVVQDNMIYLNEDTSGNTNPDIGITGAYYDTEYHHCGFFRDASDGIWKVFDNYKPEPDASVWIDTSNSTFRIADFQANNLYGFTNASTIIVGTVSTARLGSGTANSSAYLAGDNTWKAINQFVSISDIGLSANQIPINQYLGSMAYQDSSSISVTDISVSGNISGSGSISTTILGSGTANSSTYLAGDNTWKVISLTNIPNSSLVNSSITVNGTSISLGGTGTITANATTLTGSVLNPTVLTSSLTSVGTITSGTWSGSFGVVSGANLTTLNANNISSGTVSTARLATGTANSTTFLRGDQTWQTVSGFSTTDDNSTNATYYPAIVTTAGGSVARTSSTKLYFNPSTGTLSATIFNSLSDQTLKKNIINISNGLEIIEKIDAVEFEWIDSGQKSFGVIAQDLEKIVPELVATEQNKTVNYSGLIAFLIKSVQELSNKVKELENK